MAPAFFYDISTMVFTIANSFAAMPEMMQAMLRANDGPMPSYGDDPVTARLKERMTAFFGLDVSVFPVITGTAANALSLATLCPPHGAIFCHAESHIAMDECGAPEFFTHGARLVQLEGKDGKLTPDAIL